MPAGGTDECRAYARIGGAGKDAAHAQAGWLIPGGSVTEDDLLPKGLDSARYRACGNGVVAPVAEWLGRRLADALGGEDV